MRLLPTNSIISVEMLGTTYVTLHHGSHYFHFRESKKKHSAVLMIRHGCVHMCFVQTTLNRAFL